MGILYDTGPRNAPVLELIGLLQQGWAHTWLPEQGGLLGECGWNDSKEELRRRPAVGWIRAWGAGSGRLVIGCLSILLKAGGAKQSWASSVRAVIAQKRAVLVLLPFCCSLGQNSISCLPFLLALPLISERYQRLIISGVYFHFLRPSFWPDSALWDIVL